MTINKKRIFIILILIIATVLTIFFVLIFTKYKSKTRLNQNYLENTQFSRTSTNGAQFKQMYLSNSFPEEYQPYIDELKKKYPNWEFKALYTNLDWNYVIDNENKFGVNLVPKSYSDSWKNTKPGEYNVEVDSGWVDSSRAAVEYAMDPRNFLNYVRVFQFEELSYNSSTNNTESIEKISRYEDIAVEKSVKSQIELSGGIVSDINNCDLILLVNNFKNIQGDLVMNYEEPLFDKDLSLPEKPYFIADILNANGSDDNFVKAFLDKEDIGDFYGYAAWNTTGNTLGSAISTALMLYCAENPDFEAFWNLQLTRFLDDWAYQANVRRIFYQNNNEISKLKTYIQEYEKIVCNKFKIENIQIKYTFPWNRLFEINVELIKKQQPDSVTL